MPKDSIEHSKGPVFILQAKNDYRAQPAAALGKTRKAQDGRRFIRGLETLPEKVTGKCFDPLRLFQLQPERWSCGAGSCSDRRCWPFWVSARRVGGSCDRCWPPLAMTMEREENTYSCRRCEGCSCYGPVLFGGYVQPRTEDGFHLSGG